MEEFKVEDEDLYEILEISPKCSTKEIKKAYRKKALQYHPDKNPDNPNAAKLFHKLTQVLEVLVDTAARAAYDRVLNGKKEAALRHKELDSKRRKLKEDLEAREQAAKNSASRTKSNAQLLNEEIERLREEGAKLVQEEMEYVNRKFQEELNNMNDCNNCRVKINWIATKGDVSNAGYNEELLEKLLSQYGNITALLISSKKRGSALVEFETPQAAEMAIQLEHGLPINPLTLSRVNQGRKSKTDSNIVGNTIKPSDYESIVITKLKQAEERKKLIEQIMAEDNRDQ